MAAVSPANTSAPIAGINDQKSVDKTSKAYLLWFIFISKKGALRDVGFSCLERVGKLFLGVGVIVIAFNKIDQFSSEPYTTILKVSLVIIAIGFVVYSLISLKKILVQGFNRLVAFRDKFEEIQRILSEAVSKAANFEEQEVAFQACNAELDKRIKLLEEKIEVIVSVDDEESANDLIEEALELMEKLEEINSTIHSEDIDEAFQQEDWDEIVQMMPGVIEQQGKLQEARSQLLIRFRQLIVCFDELFEEMGITYKKI